MLFVKIENNYLNLQWRQKERKKNMIVIREELINEIKNYLVSKQLNKKEMQLLDEYICQEIETKSLEPNFDILNDTLGELEERFSNIEFGCFWKDEKTSDGVHELERVDYKSILKKIVEVNDINERWKLSLKASSILSSMILEAQDQAGKLVNGSMGEWCPNTGSSIENLWKKILEKDAQDSNKDALCPKLIDRLQKVVIGNSLPDYG